MNVSCFSFLAESASLKIQNKWRTGKYQDAGGPKGPERILTQINLLKYLDPSVQTLNPLDVDHWLRADRKQFKRGINSLSHQI